MRTFVAIVEAGSITSAADRINVSKKLASKYLAELEAHVGVRLLQRTTRSQSLTTAGQQYFVDCQKIIARIDESHAALQQSHGQISGHLRITAPISFGEEVLLDILARFRSKNPELTIDLRLSDHYVDLVEGGFDFAIRIGNLADSNLVARRLAKATLWVVVSPEYVESRGVPETPNDLRDHDCLRDSNYRDGPRWPFQIDGVQRKISITPSFVVNSAAALKKLVLAGEGVGLIPDFMVQKDVEARKLVRILDEFPTMDLPVQSVHALNRQSPKRVRAAIDFIAKSLST